MEEKAEGNTQKHEFLYLGTRAFPAQRLFSAALRLCRTLALFALCPGFSRCRSRPGCGCRCRHRREPGFRRSFQSRDHRVARGAGTIPIVVIVVVVVFRIAIILTMFAAEKA